MSLETGPAANLRAESPLSSGRNSPSVARLKQHDEEEVLKKDKGYRRYAAGVDRVLASFETSIVEWADYISFLARLHKALSARPAGLTDIPHKGLVAKRLSQCLDPALPSGAHQKAIEVYAYIFQTCGRDGLSANLSIYLPGLSPVLSFASLSIRPNILSLYEKYIVSLNPIALRPALKALILTFLPGLEEENSEDFDRCLQLLDRLRERIAEPTGTGKDGKAPSDQFFWQCLFLACITSASRRPGVLVFLTKRLPHLGLPLQDLTSSPSDPASPSQPNGQTELIDEAVASVASPEPGLLIRCFCAGLRDDQILVQRGFLDLLVSHLPLHSRALQKLAPGDDLKRLVAAATAVVARRDMSLNRRLWAWFMGPEPAGEITNSSILSPTTSQSAAPSTPKNDTVSAQVRYFEHNGLSSLTGSLKDMIASDPKTPSERARPLRVCLSLMDRWDIGGLVIPRVFIPALRSAWTYQSVAPSKDAQGEVLRSANMFFDAVESGLIWSEIYRLVEDALTIREGSHGVSVEKLEFLLFIITKFNVREEEMQVVHMPVVSLYALLQLPAWAAMFSKSGDTNAKGVIALTLKILLRLVDLIPARALRPEKANTDSNSRREGEDSDEQAIELEINTFYNTSFGNVDDRQPLADHNLGQCILWAAVRTTSHILQKCLGQQTQIELSVSLLGLILRKGPQKSSNVDELLNQFQVTDAENMTLANEEHSFTAALSKVSVLEALLTTPHSSHWVETRILRQTIPSLTGQLWPGLSPSRLKNNVEAARGIWKLQSASPDISLVESAIVTLMIPSVASACEESPQLEGARRFEVLWMHSPVTSTGGDHRRASMPRMKQEALRSTIHVSELFLLERPLMLILDTLEDSKGALFLFVVNWLQSLPTLVPILKAVFTRLAIHHRQATGSDPGSISSATSLGEEADLGTYLYYLQKLLHILKTSSTSIWSSLARPNTLRDADEDSNESYFSYLVTLSLSVLQIRAGKDPEQQLQVLKLKQCALSLLEQCVLSILGEKLKGKDIEKCLLDELQRAVEEEQHSLQIAVMDVLFSTLKMSVISDPSRPPTPSDTGGRQESPTPGSEGQSAPERLKAATSQPSGIPPSLLECLVLGLQSPSTRPILEHWVAFLGHCLPLYRRSVFQVLLPLVSCFCRTLESVLFDVKETFSTSGKDSRLISEPTIALLLNGLEQTLATAHEQLTTEETKGPPAKASEQPQSGFFGGMVPGVFGTETMRPKTSAGNRRLTVLLCFKDAIRMAFQLWSWGDSGKDNSLGDMSASLSFSYVTLRLRNRTRRLFEHLFAVEPLECLETLVESWQKAAKEDNAGAAAGVLNLINALESSRPKNAIPAIFNAIYSRTNPAALEPSRKSTLTSDITDTSFAAFLVAYARSLDDDAMDEIWTDCVTFLRDVLANPMPHRQVLAKLVEFTAILGMKAENTNFGEQKKMRRELGDLFNRLLTATLTIRPLAYSGDESNQTEANTSRGSIDARPVLGAESLVSVLATIAPDLSKILADADRLTATSNVISTQVVLPMIRARAFPENVNGRAMELLKAMSHIPEASKSFKRDVGEAFNDPRFFSTAFDFIRDNWMTVLRSWALADKERMPDLVSRLPYPSSAGLFGVGATSARLEADRKTQLNLRRIALLLLATPADTFSAHLKTLQAKLTDLLRATADSSPSSRTRAEVYMAMRALVLRTTPSLLSSFWPTIYSELVEALSCAIPGGGEPDGDTEPTAPPPACLLHACKLLDALLALGADDFHLHEWLFIADTTDAVYRPAAHLSVALADDLAEALDAGDDAAAGSGRSFAAQGADGRRRPLLAGAFSRDTPPEKLVDAVVRPFLRQLSINAFESTYGMLAVDEDVCADDLLADLAWEDTIA